MKDLLSVDFQKQYRRGPTIRARFSQPDDSFHSTVLFGPSGSGKTTILRCLAGLERPDSGMIRMGSHTWFDAAQGIHLRPQVRGIGFLFQDYALFPHLTVEKNIAYGLSRLSRSDARHRMGDLLDLLQLRGLEKRLPRQLSSGQQQRVALARAVAPRPTLLLLDEPLSALDAPTRQSLRRELRTILIELKTPTMIVTHDLMEAVALADRAVILIDGQVRQQGPLHEVFSRPADPTVARIVGVETIEPGEILGITDGLAQVRLGTPDTQLQAVAPGMASGPVFVCIRGEDVTLERGVPLQTSARNRLPGRVVSLFSEGATVRVQLDCGFPLTALVTRPSVEQLQLRQGETVAVLVKAQVIHLVPR